MGFGDNVGGNSRSTDNRPAPPPPKPQARGFAQQDRADAIRERMQNREPRPATRGRDVRPAGFENTAPSSAVSEFHQQTFGQAPQTGAATTRSSTSATKTAPSASPVSGRSISNLPAGVGPTGRAQAAALPTMPNSGTRGRMTTPLTPDALRAGFNYGRNGAQYISGGSDNRRGRRRSRG